jgi:hypothetical protein
VYHYLFLTLCFVPPPPPPNRLDVLSCVVPTRDVAVDYLVFWFRWVCSIGSRDVPRKGLFVLWGRVGV